MPMVLVLRHPCAVAHSYVKHGWHATTDTLLAQPALLEDFLEPHREAIAGAADAFERALFIWSIETLVPLRQFRPDELHVVFYEQLVDEPETEIPRLFAFLKKPYDASALASVTRPSRTSRRDSAVATGENVTRSWLAKIDAARVRRAREIVTRFGLDGLYSETGRPNPAALRALMAG
jgi:hypothetical protein